MCWSIVIAAMVLEIASSVSYYGPAWTYDNESSWPGSKCREGGKRQSPIDIRTTDVVRDFNSQFIKYGALKFIGYQKVLVSGVNNGHTIQFSSEGDETIHPVLTGGPLKHQYRLEQMHFHWLSEHSVNGMKYPMEIHFVHVRSDLTVMEALRKRDGLAIVAVFCQVQSDLDDFDAENTEELAQNIPRLLNTGDRVSGILLDMTKLLSPNKYNYFTYSGSLTSPECNEVVIWIIFESPIYMSDAQYRMFGKVGVGRHNFRSLQKLNNQLVYCPPASHINTPKIVIFFESVVKLVAEFFKNVTTYMGRGLNKR